MSDDFKNCWGKKDEEKGTFLNLLSHSADVAAVVAELLKVSLIRKRLARLGGLQDFVEAQIHALCFFAALHDLGKVSILFQQGIRSELKGRSIKWGHQDGALQTLINVSGQSDRSHPPPLLDLIPEHLFALDEGSADRRSPLRSFLICTVCHHGEPLTLGSTEIKEDCWTPQRGLDPRAALEALIDSARGWFPKVDSPEAQLPFGPPKLGGPEPQPWERPQSAFLHGWNAVLTLADWIGSNQKFFPFEHQGEDRFVWAQRQARQVVRDIGLNPLSIRAQLPEKLSFQEIFGLEPRPAQARIGDLSRPDLAPSITGGSTAVLEAGTGTGKTEAALWHFARLFHAGHVDGLFFALPTRSAATQIQRRIETFIKDRLFKDVPDAERPAVIQAVPGYLRADGIDGGIDGIPFSRADVESLEDLENAAGKKESGKRLDRRAWSAERSKTYTAGAFVVGTIDQVLMSALKVRHAHLRLAGLLRHLLIIDEVHASDSYMGRLLEGVLLRHRQAGGHALLMSATLGANARARFLRPERWRKDVRISFDDAVAFPYPMLQLQTGDGEPQPPIEIHLSKEQKKKLTKKVRLNAKGHGAIDNPKKIAHLAFKAARCGAKVLVIRNTVKGCLAVQEALEALAIKKGKPQLLFAVRHTETGERLLAPHHSRFDRRARTALDRAVEAAFHPDPKKRPSGGMVVVATQTVEQSLDIDADLMITDLCPMDVLLQRIGRLHRHRKLARPEGFGKPQIIILTPEIALSELIQKSGKAYGTHGLGGLVYHDLRGIEATLQTLGKCKGKLKLSEQNRWLVESSTHPEVLDRIGREHPDLAEHWKKHGQSILRQELSEEQFAEHALMPWNEDFGFFDLNEREAHDIRSRLGEKDLVVDFPKTFSNAFGLPVDELNIAPHLFPKDPYTPADNTSVEIIPNQKKGVTRFQFLGTQFHYDRKGLRTSFYRVDPQSADGS